MTATARLPNLSRLHALRAENGMAAQEMANISDRFQTLKQRHENGTAPRAVSAFQLFQTPPELARRMVELAGDRAALSVLEPSAGLGRILDALAPVKPAELVAVEVAQQCANELRRREGLRLIHQDFLTLDPLEVGQFDAVMMNPPFHMRADIRHIQHARKFLLPGGVIVALCMDTHHREAALRPLAATWEKIPAGAFKSSNTNVPIVMLTIRA